MNKKLSSHFVIDPEVNNALINNLPIVALESTVVTHGLPFPQNLELAQGMEQDIRDLGAIPATIALLEGNIHIGLNDGQMRALIDSEKPRKISRRDFAIAIARKEFGGTTVAGTMIASEEAGIKVFATGGIGGVHRNAPFDVSADLRELSQTPTIVVCAGAKAILDLPSTVEYLETMGVPTIGWKVDDFPAFYSRSSGLPVNCRADSAEEIAQIANAHWRLGMQSGILIVAPPPEEFALPFEEIDKTIKQALSEAEEQGVLGFEMTPFLLKRVSELSGGASLRVNLDLLHNNARIAAKIANALSTATAGLQQA